MNYYINFSIKSSSIGFDEPHLGGARTDGNAIFIDGIRIDDIVLYDRRP